MKEKLIVTAKFGEVVYQSESAPYNSNAHQEQYESCIKSIYNQMKDDGRYETKTLMYILMKLRNVEYELEEY